MKAITTILSERLGKKAKFTLQKVMMCTFLACGLAAVVSFTQHEYFETITERKLKEKISEIDCQYNALALHIDSLEQILTHIEFRDDHVYRLVLGVEPLAASIREGEAGDDERYAIVRKKQIVNAELIIELNSQVNKLLRKLRIESLSQDELIQLTEERNKLYAAIPDIQPISIYDLKGLTSGFGYRFHPLYEVVMKHKGIDFSATEGTDVFATADGEITSTDTTFSTAGRMITIDHGFGYQTRYAHLEGFAVAPGAHVKRGERIGFVGNTGLSTGPHLHYEVLVKGVQVDPVNYFFHQRLASNFESKQQFALLPASQHGN